MHCLGQNHIQFGTKLFLVLYTINFTLGQKYLNHNQPFPFVSNPKSDLIHNPDPLWVSSVEALQVRNKPSLIVCYWIAANFLLFAIGLII